MSDAWEVPGHYVIEPDEAVAYGLAEATWYAMPGRWATLDSPIEATCITRSAEAVEVLSNRDDYSDEKIEWAVNTVLIVVHDPVRWKARDDL